MSKWSLLLVIASIVLISCEEGKKNPVLESPVPDPEPSPHIITSSYYFQGVFGGDTITLQEEVLDTVHNNWYFINVAEEQAKFAVLDSMGDTTGYQLCPSSVLYNLDYFLDPKIFQDPEVNPILVRGGVGFPKGFDELPWDVGEYVGIVPHSPSRMSWGRLAVDSLRQLGADGFRVFLVDEKGVMWASDQGITIQPYDLPKMIRNVENEDGTTYRTVAMAFSARLYNKNGEYKDFIDGKFRGRIFSPSVIP